MTNFNKQFFADSPSQPVHAEHLAKYADKVPKYLQELWKSNGFGKYNGGLIEIIDPADFESVLWTWLGREVENYVPFAITGFGELFYYRKLSDGEEDVCLIDIQYRKIETLIWDFEAFFEEFLVQEENKKLWLREDLFKKALEEKGALGKQEVFTFVPILAFGGAEEIQFIQKGKVQVYQELVFQMTM